MFFSELYKNGESEYNMSIAEKVSLIEINRNTIRAKLVELGMATSSDKLETLAEVISNLVNRGAVSVTVKEGDTYTIPAGYHNGSGTVSGVAGGGNYSLQSKNATPTKKQQSITPDDGYFGLSNVTISPIPDAYQDVTSVTATVGDVLVGKVFVQKDGTVTPGAMANNGNIDKYLDATANNAGYRIPAGYHAGAGHVSIRLESKTATPSKTQQSVKPTNGKVLSEVVVDPIPAQYQDVSGVTAVAADVLSGKKIVSKTGAVIYGAMPVNGAINATIDGLNTTSCTIPAGHTTGGTVSLTNDIEDALDAIVGGTNTSIKKELDALAESKANIAAAIESKGVTVPTGTKLDGMASLIGQIETGGGAEMISGRLTTGADAFILHFTDESGYHRYEGWDKAITCLKDSLIFIENSSSYVYGITVTGAEVVYAHTYEKYNEVFGGYETRADLLVRVKNNGFIVNP